MAQQTALGKRLAGNKSNRCIESSALAWVPGCETSFVFLWSCPLLRCRLIKLSTINLHDWITISYLNVYHSSLDLISTVLVNIA